MPTARLPDRQPRRRRRQGAPARTCRASRSCARTASTCAACDTRDLDHARELAARGGRRAARPSLRSAATAWSAPSPTSCGSSPGAVLGRAPRRPRQRPRTRARHSRRPVGGLRDDRGAASPRRSISASSSDGDRRCAGGPSSASPLSASTATRTASPTRRLPGSAALVYAYGALRALALLAPGALRDRARPARTSATASSPTPSAPPTRRLRRRHARGPGALLDDGLLEVMVLENVSKLTLPHADPAEGVQRHARRAAERQRVPRAPRSRSARPPVHDVCRRRSDRRAAGPRARPAGRGDDARPPDRAAASRLRRAGAGLPGEPADGERARRQAGACPRRRRALAHARRRRDERAREGPDAP